MAAPSDLEYRKKMFKECYKNIENFLYQGHQHCLCKLHTGPTTELDFLTRTRNICCVCSFPSRFDIGMLHRVKHDTVKLRALFDEVLKVCIEAVRLCCTDFWERDIYYSVTNVNENKTHLCALDNDFDFSFGL